MTWTVYLLDGVLFHYDTEEEARQVYEEHYEHIKNTVSETRAKDLWIKEGYWV